MIGSELRLLALPDEPSRLKPINRAGMRTVAENHGKVPARSRNARHRNAAVRPRRLNNRAETRTDRKARRLAALSSMMRIGAVSAHSRPMRCGSRAPVGAVMRSMPIACAASQSRAASVRTASSSSTVSTGLAHNRWRRSLETWRSRSPATTLARDSNDRDGGELRQQIGWPGGLVAHPSSAS